MYSSRLVFSFVPLQFTPYAQAIKWDRIGQGNGFHLYVKGERLVEIGLFHTTIIENMGTFETSIWDYITDDNQDLVPEYSELTFDDDYEVKTEDPHWTYNILNTVDPDLYAKLNENWYDYKQLF